MLYIYIYRTRRCGGVCFPSVLVFLRIYYLSKAPRFEGVLWTRAHFSLWHGVARDPENHQGSAVATGHCWRIWDRQIDRDRDRDREREKSREGPHARTHSQLELGFVVRKCPWSCGTKLRAWGFCRSTSRFWSSLKASW